MYNFLMGRASWALSVGGHNAEMNELIAYIYFHDAIRWSLSSYAEVEHFRKNPGTILPCESLTDGLIPMMYMMGMCCPLISWLQSVIEYLSLLGQGGLMNGKLLGRCLNTMYLFELHSGDDSSSLLTRFPPLSS